ncbi:MAG: ATP-binding protein [Parasporobacterium sp.]|nr:ATP-binding protein [Parasporobacterium sp.]
MIKKLVRQMLAAQTVSALTVSLCLLIDNIIIGRFLGDQALTAYELANPILLIIAALGSMLGAGIQMACSKSLGRGSQEETNEGFSSAIAAAAVVSVVFTILVLIFSRPLSTLMGASDPVLISDTGAYMSGFIIGAPASMGALILVPFLQIAGQSNLLIVAVLGMTFADVGFDLLNILVFHGGLFGMGLASSLSYYVALFIGGWYFLSKKSVFKFSLSRVHREKILELLKGGVPTIVGMIASVVLVFGMNKLLMLRMGKEAVAAFAVINSIGSACNCISTGTGGISLTLSGILFHEEDRTGLKEVFGLIARYAVILGVAVCALLLLFAPACVSLFMPRDNAASAAAVWGLRAYAPGLIFCCINNLLKSSYQGTGRIRTMEVISVLENAILPFLSALILSQFFVVHGAWLFFVCGEALTLLCVLVYVWSRKRRITWNAEDIMLLSADLGVPEKDLLEADLHNVNEVMEFSYQAEEFCLSHGYQKEMGHHISLCIEEMGTNIITHGFAESGKNHLSIRLQYKNGRFVLRFRDDCRAFDPTEHVLQHTSDSLGIRLTMHMADEARYTYSMNLNNLTLILAER